MNDSMKAYAPAKLTLTLRMLNKRNDGFNNLEALTVFLPDICDEIEIFERKNDEPFLEVLNSDLPADSDNLVTKAFKLFNQEVELPDLGFRLTKSIPSAAGLGGGSADAAAVLNALNRFSGNTIEPSQLTSMASEIGSDIPACVYSKALWMKGRGEIIEIIPSTDFENLRVLVITPNLKCSTPEIFSKYETMGRPVDIGLEAPVELSQLTQNLHNDLALAAYDLFPELIELREFLKTKTNMPVQLAGSGSSMFILGEESRINDLHDELEKSPKFKIGICFV